MSEYSEALNELVSMGVEPAETETVQLTTDEFIINAMERLTGRKKQYLHAQVAVKQQH